MTWKQKLSNVSLQIHCSDNLIDLLTPLRADVPDYAIKERIDDAMATYRSARFYEFDEIARIRAAVDGRPQHHAVHTISIGAKAQRCSPTMAQGAG